MTKDHWSSFSKYATKIGSPFSPSQQVLKKYQEVGQHAGKILVLGATAEILDCFAEPGVRRTLVVVDKSAKMIEDKVVPYCAAHPTMDITYVVDDWQAMNLPHRDFDIAIGDGCLNSVPFENIRPVLDNVMQHLKPGGVSVSRVYLSPHLSPLPDIFDHSLLSFMKMTGFSFSAFRMLIMMYVAHVQKHPNVTTSNVFAAFQDGLSKLGFGYNEFAEAGGWPEEVVQSIRIHSESNTTFCFPTQDELTGVVRKLDIAVGSSTVEHYDKCELSINCPLLVVRK